MRRLSAILLLMMSTNVQAHQPPPEGISAADWSQESFVNKAKASDADVYKIVNSVFGEEDRKPTTDVSKTRGEVNAASADK